LQPRCSALLRSGLSEVWVIKDVEELRAELDAQVLADLGVLDD